MKQQRFEARHKARWSRLEQLLISVESNEIWKNSPPNRGEHLDLPELYGEICQHLAIAKSRGYSINLIHRLHALAVRAHHQIYKRRFDLFSSFLRYFTAVFPLTVRRYLSEFWVAFFLFYGSGFIFGLICFWHPDLIYSVLDDASVAQMELMYSPESGRIIGRADDRQGTSDFLMFGYYIYNNISIGFQTFAGGILAGLGTVFYLLYNGVVIGGVSGYLTGIGYGEPFWAFVSGHGAFELNAIVISGMAGLLLAKAILAPGGLSRRSALRQSAREAVILVVGAAVMLMLAALVEAFWSPSTIVPSAGKYAFTAVAWILVVLYFVFAGRRSDEN